MLVIHFYQPGLNGQVFIRITTSMTTIPTYKSIQLYYIQIFIAVNEITYQLLKQTSSDVKLNRIPLLQRETRPEISPHIILSTSATVTRLKSPSIECLRQEAATANSSTFEYC